MVFGTETFRTIGQDTRRYSDDPNLSGFAVFNDGNPIKAFIGDRGFFVFDQDVDLTDAFSAHMSRWPMSPVANVRPAESGHL